MSLVSRFVSSHSVVNHNSRDMSRFKEKQNLAYAKTKLQISCAISNCTADERLCFRFKEITVPLLAKSKISSIYLSSVCSGRFVSGLIGTPEDCGSCDF